MKTIIISLVFAIASTFSQAQDFKKGGNYVTAGYGIDVASGLSGTVIGIGLGPIMLTYERGITDVLGIGRIGAGGGVATSFYSYNSTSVFFSTYENKYRTTRITPFIRGTYHFEFDIEKLDVYAGVGVGVNIDSEKDRYFINGVLQSETKNSRVRPVHYIVAGVRYYFTDAFGVYLELGDGIANVNGGVVFSF